MADTANKPIAPEGGSPRAESALNLRLLLAAFGLVLCGGLSAVAFVFRADTQGVTAIGVALAILAAAAAVDLVVIVRRRRRRARLDRAAQRPADHGLFG